MISEVVEIELP